MSQIKVGDLVQVVRWPCCGAGLGAIREVKEIRTARGGKWECGSCGHLRSEGVVALMDTPTGVEAGVVPIGWLKLIPPLSETEGQRTEESLRESKVNA